MLPVVARVAAAGDPDGHQLHRGAVSTLYQPAKAGELASFPYAYGVDVGPTPAGALPRRRVLVGFSQNPDSASAVVNPAAMLSSDGGWTFPPAPQPEPGCRALGRLDDGALLCVAFKPLSVSGTQVTLRTFRSTDHGSSWTKGTAQLTLPKPLSWCRVHRGITTLHTTPQTLLMPYYGAYTDDVNHRVELAQSTDGGASWTRRGVVAPGSASKGYNETSVVQAADGSLLAVMRTKTASGHGPLEWTRSQDLGQTWPAPQPLELSMAGAPAAQRPAVDPVLRLMPNGVLVLSAGRLDNWIAISRDGTGSSWELGQITYTNYPTVPATAPRTHGSSGYTGLAVVDANRLLLVGDNCANSWGCPASESGWTVDGNYRIWKAFVDVLTPDVGQIDLAGKLAAGRISIDTNLTWSSAAHPEAGPAAALDGSTAYWASAFKPPGGDAPSFTLHLDRAYELTRVGLCLHPGRSARAQVLLSEDGVSWAPAVDSGLQTHHALRYFKLSPPLRARHVRVVGQQQAQCSGELSTGCGMLNELQLYATVDSFENDPVGAVPRGYQQASMAWTTLQDVDDSRRALRLKDTSSSAMARIARSGTVSTHKSLEFRLHPVELSSGFLFGLTGTVAGEPGTAYHLGLFGDGSLNRYDAAAKTWHPLSGPGQIAQGDWATLRLVAGTGSATLCLDGQQLATLGPSAAGVSELSGHYFSSAGTVPSGSNFVVDDVRMVDRSEGCSDPPPRVADGGADRDAATTDGGPRDAATMEDAALGADAGAAGASTTGCGCSVNAAPRGPYPALVLLLAVAVLAARRRQRPSS